MKPHITLVGTPIGNLSDMSPRALETLKNAQIIYAEHPETSKRLANHFCLGEKKWVLFDQSHEKERLSELLRDSQISDVAVISRAGMPGINDPGVYLVKELLNKNIAFDVIPGPSIVTCLMATSGEFGSSHYYGYFPKKHQDSAFQIFLSAQDDGTALYLESPHRIHKTLTWLKSHLAMCPSARIVILREFTKIHQTIYSGALMDIAVGEEHEITAAGEWALSLKVDKDQLPSDFKVIPTEELKKLLRHPYPQRFEKFSQKYKLE